MLSLSGSQWRRNIKGQLTVSKPCSLLQGDLEERGERRTFQSHWGTPLENLVFSKRECVSETVRGKVDFELSLETWGRVYLLDFLPLRGAHSSLKSTGFASFPVRLPARLEGHGECCSCLRMCLLLSGFCFGASVSCFCWHSLMNDHKSLSLKIQRQHHMPPFNGIYFCLECSLAP